MFFIGGLLTLKEKEAVTLYLTTVEKDPLHYIPQDFIELYQIHPEVKLNEPFSNIPNEDLINHQEFQTKCKKSAKASAMIVKYLDDPEKAHGLYYTYGQELRRENMTYQVYKTYEEIELRNINDTAGGDTDLKTGMTKLATYTYRVVEEALGKSLRPISSK